jgi:hypothetical protein
MSPSRDVTPYETLAAISEQELALIGERRLDELPAVQQRRDALQASLPATPPVAARATLERCVLLRKRIEIELLRVREAILLELGQIRRGQRAAAGYAPARTRVERISASA